MPAKKTTRPAKSGSPKTTKKAKIEGEKAVGAKAKKAAPKPKVEKAAGAKAKKAAPKKAVKPRAKAGSKAKVGTRKRKTEGLATKLGEMLDTVTAGAIVGAVTGAARGLSGEPTAIDVEGTAGSAVAADPHGTAEVLEELTPGAAVGAILGAAKALMPKEGDDARGGD